MKKRSSRVRAKKQTASQRALPHLGWKTYLLSLALLIVAAIGTGWALNRNSKASRSAAPMAPAIPTLAQLVAMPSEELERIDIALMNLRCAEGLRGSESLDIPAALATLDRYAEHVEQETARHLYRFREHPEEYENSEPCYRLMMLATVMQEDFKTRYNPSRIPVGDRIESNAKFFADSKDIFIHGLVGPPNQGTCASMPVLYIAIGRRLGYPLHLVATKGHLFVRWEDERGKLNMDATTNGFVSESDDYYRSWPFKITEKEEKERGLLESMTAGEELAAFMGLRAACLFDGMGHFTPGIAAYKDATRLAPKNRAYRDNLAIAQQVLANRQHEQLAWLLDQPGMPMPAGLRPNR